MKVAIFVEPSPFTHISGLKNRFESLIHGLREVGDSVLVVTPDPAPPKHFFGAEVISVWGFRPPLYNSPTLLLSTGLSVHAARALWRLRPDVIHVSGPGPMVFAALLYARLLGAPLVMSYHTHIPEYIPRYTWRGLVGPAWAVIRWFVRSVDLTLVTSAAMKAELERNGCPADRIDVWQRGVDIETFHPRHRSAAMRARLSDGHPQAPLLLHVGRLAAEKNIAALLGVLQQLPEARLAIVGDGPLRLELEQLFQGVPVKFTGTLRGRDLSEAFASADAFLMPSETETLGFVVLEAMASGLPVVAVAAGGLTDVVSRPGENGLLYPPGDYATCAAHTRRLIADPAARCAMGAAARREAQRFGWAAATRHLREQQYARAVCNAKSRRRRCSQLSSATLGVLARALAGLLVALSSLLVLLAALGYALPYRPAAASNHVGGR